MNDKIKEDILSVIRLFIEYLKKKDYFSLHELSNRTIHNSSIYQDIDSNQIAVIVYAVSKILEYSQNEDLSSIEKKFIKVAQLLEKEDIERYRDLMKDIFAKISYLDSKIKVHLGEVIELAKINKGGKIYDHGVSLARASELLGITQWELATYVGKTKFGDRLTPKTNLEKKLSGARSLIKK